jgi:hypothetical protein
MIPDYTPPEGWRVVNYRDLPYNAVYTDDDEAEVRRKSHSTGDGYIGQVLVRVDPPFDFVDWATHKAIVCGITGGRDWAIARWDRNEPVAEHVQVRIPTTGIWIGASDYTTSTSTHRPPADAVFEVREKT